MTYEYGVMVPANSYAHGQPFPRPITACDLEWPQLYADRADMATELLTGKVAEVGTYLGGFARHLLLEASELHLFDRDLSRIGDLASEPGVVLHQGDSAQQLAALPDRYFDGIYVDADHSLAGVARDAKVAAAKVAPGGVLQFNDYTLWSVIEEAPYGICQAVADLLDEGFKVVGFAFQFQGYHDIALRAP